MNSYLKKNVYNLDQNNFYFFANLIFAKIIIELAISINLFEYIYNKIICNRLDIAQTAFLYKIISFNYFSMKMQTFSLLCKILKLYKTARLLCKITKPYKVIKT